MPRNIYDEATKSAILHAAIAARAEGLKLAEVFKAATAAGYQDFVPDACLINRYEAGSRLTPHQDRNERDFSWPIVSISLGLPAVFQFGGMKRTDPMARYALRHGDVVVWGGRSRLAYHGVAPLKDGEHPRLGRTRINLTLRKALGPRAK